MHTDPGPSGWAPSSLPPLAADSLLASARRLQLAGDGAATMALLRGTNLGLVCDAEDSMEARLFRHAATALGARLAHIRPSISELDTATGEGLRHTARILGRLYDGLECQGLSFSLVAQLDRDAGIPVFDGLASPHHATAALVHQLAGAESAGAKRLLILQAALLMSLPTRKPMK